MTRTPTRSLSSKALAATLAGALALTSVPVAPARADTNADAIAAAAFFGLVAAAIIATTRDDPGWSPPPSVDRRKLLPAECRFTIHSGADRGTWYGRQCLVANFGHWPLLPHRCERKVDLPRRPYDVTAYRARCLAQFGYRADDKAFSSHR